MRRDLVGKADLSAQGADNLGNHQHVQGIGGTARGVRRRRSLAAAASRANGGAVVDREGTVEICWSSGRDKHLGGRQREGGDSANGCVIGRAGAGRGRLHDGLSRSSKQSPRPWLWRA